ncbi:MAG: hypothetical protein EBV05_08295 [Cyanobacteria bacterium WB6_1B_304]|jgi:hypothetical protein|nr:hypothetical protein [Cyanobacteria bacterium WB6_1B_304]
MPAQWKGDIPTPWAWVHPNLQPLPYPFPDSQQRGGDPPSLPVLDEEEGGDVGDVTSQEWEVI